MPPDYPPQAPQIPYPKTLPPPPPPVGVGPEPGPQPQASGPAYTTYDPLTGVFKDPAGGAGIFVGGISGASSAENWVDLMLAPRTM